MIRFRLRVCVLGWVEGDEVVGSMVAEYIDEDEPFRKEKERQIVEEGRSVSSLI